MKWEWNMCMKFERNKHIATVIQFFEDKVTMVQGS